MPKIDGIEVLEVIKSDKEHEDVKNIPVVMLTVSTLEKDKSECIKAGCDGYFIKDGSFKDFEKIINPLEELFKKKRVS